MVFLSTPPLNLAYLSTADSEHTRPRKRQRVAVLRSIPLSTHNIIDQTVGKTLPESMIKLAQSDRDSPLSTSPDMSALAGPSSGNGIVPSKGYTNGFSSSSNGTSGGVAQISNGVRHGKSIARVNPPGTTLYDDSVVDREEFVRLVVQSLRDVGYV